MDRSYSSSGRTTLDYEMPRYDGMAQALHWLSALLILAVLPLAWVAVSRPGRSAAGTS